MGADLTEANLFGADLRTADLFGADLSRANLTKIFTTPDQLAHMKSGVYLKSKVYIDSCQ